MTVPGNDPLLITLLASVTACSGYVAGRVHQWYRTGLERDDAYRDGYDTATRSVFSMAARLIGPRRVAVPSVTVVEGSIDSPPAVPRGVRSLPVSVSAGSLSSSDDDEGVGRHYVPDELVKAPTYRLTPDRVARAKVRGAVPADENAPDTTRLPPVPRPRSS
jgi:hypothetical protein